MGSNFDDPLHDFDLNYLPKAIEPPADELHEKTRRQIKILKSKIIGTDSMIKGYLGKTEEIKLLHSTEEQSKQKLRNTFIKLNEASDECRKLENENKECKAKAAEYEKKAIHFEDQCNALKSHSNQLQILVKELETQIEGLALEKQLEASNVKATDNKMLKLQKDNESMLKDILSLKEVVLGRKKLGKAHVILLKKYERDKKHQNTCVSDESIYDTDDDDDPPSSPLMPPTRSEISKKKDHYIEEEPLLSKILDAVNNENKGQQNPNCIDHDYDRSHDVASFDTGRGSSRTNSFEESLSSPDYFIQVPSAEKANLISEDRKRHKEVANSPIIVQEFISIATSPVMFKDFTSISVATSPIKFDNLISNSIATSPIIFDNITSISIATSPITFNELTNEQHKECLTKAELIDGKDIPISMEIFETIEQEKKCLVDTCKSPISVSSESAAEISTATSPMKYNKNTTANKNLRKSSPVCPLLLNENKLNQTDRELENKLVDNDSENNVPKMGNGAGNNEKEISVIALEKECLEKHNSHNLCIESSSDQEIEHILKTMKFNHDLITPIPITPINNVSTSKTPVTVLKKENLSILAKSNTLKSPPIITITDSPEPETPPIITKLNINDIERIIDLETKAAYFEENFGKVFAELESLKKAIKLRKRSKIGKIINKEKSAKYVVNQHTEPKNNESKPDRKDEESNVVSAKETMNIEEGNKGKEIHIEQSKDDVKLNEVCDDGIKQMFSTETTTKTIMMKKRNTSKLEKLRQKLIPTGKIKRAPSPLIPKRLTKLKITPISNNTAVLSLKNKLAYENAVKVITGLKLKQNENELKSEKFEKCTGMDMENMKLDCNLNDSDTPTKSTLVSNKEGKLDHIIQPLSVSVSEMNAPVKNKDAPASESVSKIDRNESIHNGSVSSLPVSSIKQNSFENGVQLPPVPNLNDSYTPMNPMFVSIKEESNLENSAQVPAPISKICKNTPVNDKYIQPSLSASKNNRNELAQNIPVALLPASKINRNVPVDNADVPPLVSVSKINKNPPILPRPESVIKINRNDSMQNAPVQILPVSNIKQNSVGKTAQVPPVSNLNNSDKPMKPIFVSNTEEKMLENSIHISTTSVSKINNNAAVKNEDMPPPVSVSKINRNDFSQNIVMPTVHVINTEHNPSNNNTQVATVSVNKIKQNDSLQETDITSSPICKVIQNASVNNNIGVQSLTGKADKDLSSINVKPVSVSMIHRNAFLQYRVMPHLPIGNVEQNAAVDNTEVPIRSVSTIKQNVSIKNAGVPQVSVGVPLSPMRKADESASLYTVETPLSPSSGIDENGLFNCNIRYTRSLTRRLSKREEDSKLSISPQKIFKMGDYSSSPDKTPEKHRGRKRPYDHAEDNTLKSCKRALRMSYESPIVKESSSVLIRNEDLARKKLQDEQEQSSHIKHAMHSETSGLFVTQDTNIMDTLQDNQTKSTNHSPVKSITGVIMRCDSNKDDPSNIHMVKTSTADNKCAAKSLQSKQEVSIQNKNITKEVLDTKKIVTGSIIGPTVRDPSSSVNNQKNYVKSPSNAIDKARKLQPVVVLNNMKIRQTDSIQHTIVDYGDLNLYTENNDKVTKAKTLTELSPLKQNVLCSAIDKHGVVTVKYFSKKIPDEIKNRIALIIEEGITKITLQPVEKQKSAMKDLYNSLLVHKKKHILSGLMAYLKDVARKLELFGKVTKPPAPPMTKPEIILLYVIEQLNNSSGGDFVHRVWSSIEHTIFQLGRSPHFDLIDSLSHFYAVMCRFFRNKSRLRCFMLDAMYCLQFKAIPLIRQCLDVCPFVLPQAHERLAKSSLVTCLVYLLHFYKCYDKFNRAQQIRDILQKKYSYSFGEWNETMILEIFRKAIIGLRGTQNDKKMLRIALILICKRNGAKWCEANVLQNMLMPLIEEPNVPEKVKTFCILMLGPLLKPFPADRKVRCEIIIDHLHRILEQNPSHAIKEAIYSSLIFMSKHDQDRVVQSLLMWNPPHISPEFEEILNDYVMEKPLKTWKNLVTKKTTPSYNMVGEI